MRQATNISSGMTLARWTIVLALLLVAGPAYAADAPTLPNAPRSRLPEGSTPEARNQWIARYCSRAQNDPQCQFHIRKQMYAAMRAMQKSDKVKKEDAYCETNIDDQECVLKRTREEKRYFREKLLELKEYCKKDPEAPRCGFFFATGEIDAAPKSDEAPKDPDALIIPRVGSSSPADAGEADWSNDLNTEIQGVGSSFGD